MAQTGHRSVTMVRRYIRDANLFVRPRRSPTKVGDADPR
jgi:hypothetical protein